MAYKYNIHGIIRKSRKISIVKYTNGSGKICLIHGWSGDSGFDDASELVRPICLYWHMIVQSSGAGRCPVPDAMCGRIGCRCRFAVMGCFFLTGTQLKIVLPGSGSRRCERPDHPNGLI